MIFIGYQGIGKSTLAKNNIRFIDLESGNFWINGQRDSDWYKPYCNIANDLSEQGYHVFVSSHEVVRKQLLWSKQRVISIVPAIDLRDAWLDKLQKRYHLTELSKDYKALMNASDRYEANIKEIISETKEHIILTKMNYSLGLEIERYVTNLYLKEVP